MRYLPADVPWLDQRHVRMCIEDGSFLWSVVSLIQAARYLGPVRGELCTCPSHQPNILRLSDVHPFPGVLSHLHLSAAFGRSLIRKPSDRQVDFATLPADALHRYLACFDLIPELEPSPLTAEDPGPPTSLLRARSHLPAHGHALRRTSTASPGPGGPGTTANRPRRDPGASRRRSSRLVEEERIPAPPPVYGDLAEVNGVLAGIAERHFREYEVKEVDTLAAFMCAVKAKGMFKDSV